LPLLDFLETGSGRRVKHISCSTLVIDVGKNATSRKNEEKTREQEKNEGLIRKRKTNECSQDQS